MSMEHHVNNFNNALISGSFGNDLEIVKQIIQKYKELDELNDKLSNTKIHYSVYMSDKDNNPGSDYMDFYITTNDLKVHYAPLYYLEDYIKEK